MAMSLDDVVAKIRKLRALATSSNEHEAAAAAARAAELMQAYRIEEASLDSGSAEGPAEEVGHHTFEKSGKKVHWKISIAGGCAAVTGCGCYTSGPNIKLVGRESDVRAARYLFDLIVPQVERLAEDCFYLDYYGDESKRTWKNGFRLGCSRKIRARMEQQARMGMDRLRAQARQGQKLLGGDGAELGAASTALAVIDRRQDAVDKVMQGMRLSKPRPAQTAGSDGYRMGKQAGDRVNIGGQARGSLGAPRPSLKG